MKITNDDGYPLTPTDAARKIVSEFLADLPPNRQQDVRNAIEEWGMAWGDLTSSVAGECGCEY